MKFSLHVSLRMIHTIKVLYILVFNRNFTVPIVGVGCVVNYLPSNTFFSAKFGHIFQPILGKSKNYNAVKTELIMLKIWC